MQVIGHLGKDCVVKEVSGKNVINFTVAHSEKWKDAQGNQKEKTTWVEAAYWTDKTTVAQYLTKGKQIYVEGIPEADAYKDKDDNAKGTLRLRVTSVQLLGGASEGSSQPNNPVEKSAQKQSPLEYSKTAEATDDLPF